MRDIEILAQLRNDEPVSLQEVDAALQDMLSRINIIDWQLGDATRKVETEAKEYRAWRSRAIRARQILTEGYREVKKYRAQLFSKAKVWNAREVIGMGADSDPDELLSLCKLMISKWVRQGKVELNEEESAVLDLTSDYLSEELDR